MELQGKLLVKGETQSFGSNGFTKREFVIETDDKFPQKIQLELIKDKCSLLDNFQIGQPLKAAININGREWTNKQNETKYFNSIQAWKLEAVGNAPIPSNEVFEPATDLNEDEEDDLPF